MVFITWGHFSERRQKRSPIGLRTVPDEVNFLFKAGLFKQGVSKDKRGKDDGDHRH